MKGQVVVLLFDNEDAIYDSARETVWRGLKEIEQARVTFLEGEEQLHTRFWLLQNQFRGESEFPIPEDLFQPEQAAFETMHRFADELQAILDAHWETKKMIDDFNLDGKPYVPGPRLSGLRKTRTLPVRKKKIRVREGST